MGQKAEFIRSNPKIKKLLKHQAKDAGETMTKYLLSLLLEREEKLQIEKRLAKGAVIQSHTNQSNSVPPKDKDQTQNTSQEGTVIQNNKEVIPWLTIKL